MIRLSPLIATTARRRTWHPVVELAIVLVLVGVVVAGMWLWSWR